LMTSIDPGLL